MKNTLQARLIILMILSTIFLISAFTFIQLNNQIQRVQEFNTYRAKQSALLLRDKLREMFLNSAAEPPLPQAVAQIKEIFSAILEAGDVETAAVLDKEGKFVVLEGKLNLALEENKDSLDEISKTKDSSKWLIPVIDKEHKLVNLYVTVDNPYGFIFKLTFSSGNTQEALNQVYGPVTLTILLVIISSILLGVFLSRALIWPVQILNRATKEIAGGNLDLKITSINTQDELEELSDTFNYMTVELKKMKARAENANPLTKLPGNIVIREEAENRIRENKKFVLIYSDLDNFKAFNDKHGVEAGDEAILLTANIMKEAVAKEGKVGDFLGHEGGDDFLLLTVPERAQKLASYITSEFDKRIRPLYAEEELQKGYIEAHARDTNEIRRFPIMTISLAGAGNWERTITSYSELTNIAAEVKKIAKKMQSSNFVLDRRIEDFGKESRGQVQDE
jgi:diguanylate cyclase (GGDEF)-like protein